MSIDPVDKLFCEIGSDLNFLDQDQIDRALEAQRVDRALGEKKPIGAYLHEQNILSKEQISQILRMQDKFGPQAGLSLTQGASLSPVSSTNCHIHPGVASIGTCVGCGRFICSDCNTALKGKNFCKACVSEKLSEVERKVERLEDKGSTPMVFMNAGGGSSSSAAASASSAAGIPYVEGELTLTKNREYAAVFAIFLGTFGAHKFYLGKWGQGICYTLLCTTGIPTVLGFFEGFYYLFKTDQEFELNYVRNGIVVRDGDVRRIR